MGEQSSLGDDFGALPLPWLAYLSTIICAMEYQGEWEGGHDGRHGSQIR